MHIEYEGFFGAFEDKKPKIVYVNEFTESSAKKFYEDFQEALAHSSNCIPVIIDSYGGYVDSFMVMADIIKSSSVPVATICLGKAMSCGIMLLAMGTEGLRFAAPSSRLMMHHVSGVSWGKVEDIKVSTSEIERLQKQAFEMVSLSCGKQKHYFHNLLKKKGNVDWYLTPQEAKRHCIINNIGVPTMKIGLIMKTEIK